MPSNYQVLIVGDKDVGKTQLVSAMHNPDRGMDVRNSRKMVTVGADFVNCSIGPDKLQL